MVTPTQMNVLITARAPPLTAASDFVSGSYRQAGQTFSNLLSLPGTSLSRPSAGTGLDVAGNVMSFASGVPRITNLGLLVEQSATNSLLQSQTFDSATWVKTNATVTADATTAPDGTATADKLIASVGSAQHYVLQAVSGLTALEARTVSVYAKYAGVQYLAMFMSQGPAQAWFDLQGGTVSNITGAATITALANGWYRCTITNASAGGTSDNYELHTAATAGSFTHTGDGVNGIYLWGAQLERPADSATSYIPTTSAAATRAADNLKLTSFSIPASGTATSSILWPANISSSPRVLGDTSTFPSLLNLSSNSAQMYNGTTVVSKTLSAPTAGSLVRLASAWDASGRSVTGSGLTPATDVNSVGTFSGLQIGSDHSQGSYLNSYIQSIVIYPTRMSGAQLQALTR